MKIYIICIIAILAIVFILGTPTHPKHYYLTRDYDCCLFRIIDSTEKGMNLGHPFMVMNIYIHKYREGEKDTSVSLFATDTLLCNPWDKYNMDSVATALAVWSDSIFTHSKER